jgi:hypothetical protein
MVLAIAGALPPSRVSAGTFNRGAVRRPPAVTAILSGWYFPALAFPIVEHLQMLAGKLAA